MIFFGAADEMIPHNIYRSPKVVDWFPQQPLDGAKHIECDTVLRIYPYFRHDSIETRAVTNGSPAMARAIFNGVNRRRSLCICVKISHCAKWASHSSSSI